MSALSPDRPEQEPARSLRFIDRLPTGAKVFLILGFALFPLAIVAVLASLQTSRIADQESAARLRVAAAEASRALTIELVGDMAALRTAVGALNRDASDRAACARVNGVYAAQHTAGVRFQVTSDAGLLCGGGVPADTAIFPDDGGIASRIGQNGLALAIGSRDGRTRGVALFPTGFLAEVARPSAFAAPYEATILRGSERLPLETLSDGGLLDRSEQVRMPLGVQPLMLELRLRGAPITSTLILAMLLPLLMWITAASIGWFVVDRLLIRPLRQLRAVVGAYRPGETLSPARLGALPAREIRELGATFRDITLTVQAHEANLAEGLVRQTKLTREVHHRVKNNLQVIASLINFHARGAQDPASSEAYAAIQRRVDALAVVHRHHFAELEENRGLELRAVLGELASNLRANAPDAAAATAITLNVEPLLVSQDVAVAVAFLTTELVELAMTASPASQISISVRQSGDMPSQAMLRISSPGLRDGPQQQALMDSRYGRILTGLARQLRSRLHHDPLVGAYELTIAVLPAPDPGGAG